jgi:hypothetical protein
MKLRLYNNSIRLRLGRGEVARVAAGECVEERVDFGGNVSLRYSLQVSTGAAQASARFSNGHLMILVPLDEARDWAATERVGIDASQPSSAGQSLRILIEKDFECLDNPAENSTDAFTNPAANPACGASLSVPINPPRSER